MSFAFCPLSHVTCLVQSPRGEHGQFKKKIEEASLLLNAHLNRKREAESLPLESPTAVLEKGMGTPQYTLSAQENAFSKDTSAFEGIGVCLSLRKKIGGGGEGRGGLGGGGGRGVGGGKGGWGVGLERGGGGCFF